MQDGHPRLRLQQALAPSTAPGRAPAGMPFAVPGQGWVLPGEVLQVDSPARTCTCLRLDAQPGGCLQLWQECTAALRCAGGTEGGKPLAPAG